MRTQQVLAIYSPPLQTLGIFAAELNRLPYERRQCFLKAILVPHRLVQYNIGMTHQLANAFHFKAQASASATLSLCRALKTYQDEYQDEKM